MIFISFKTQFLKTDVVLSCVDIINEENYFDNMRPKLDILNEKKMSKIDFF